MAVIVINAKSGEKFFLGENGPVKQKGRARNCFTKTAQKQIDSFRTTEWFTQYGKGAKFSVEASLPGSIGRPKGSKNVQKTDQPVTAKRGAGRPKGSKNMVATDQPKRRGRPPGSKNKPKVMEAVTG